jgi:hypothetical protein
MMKIQCPSFKQIATSVASTLILLAGIAGFTVPALAQSSSSSVNGVATDPAAAVVAEARVTLRDVDTNVERVTVTNAGGDYFFPDVPPARYTLTFSAKGFQTESILAFPVAVAQIVTINAVLKIGDVSQSITVQATGVQVESSTAQLGTVIDEKTVNSLPLNGRNFTQLLTLTPGVSPISTDQNSSASNTAITPTSSYTFPSINGAGNRSTLYLVDGMNDNQAWYNTYAVPPIIDTIQEFKVNSHNDSEYGGSLGGVVNVITKAGTNTYHGSGWEFLRSNGFNALPYFRSTVQPSYHLNMFGGQVGGPIRIPHLYNGMDKTFFEIGVEATRYSASGASNILIPTQAQLNGDFGSATTGVTTGGTCSPGSYSTGACQLYDPTAGGNSFQATNNYGPYRPAYLGNQIPVSEMNPYSLAFVKAVFGAVTPIVIPGISPTTANYQITNPTQEPVYNYTGRIDQHIGTRDFIFFRYSGFQSDETSPSSVPTLFTNTLLPAQQYVVNWAHIFNPNTSMQVQYGKTHVAQDTSTLFQNRNLWQTYGCASDMCDSFVGNVALLLTQSVSGGFAGGEDNSPSSNLSSIHEWSGSVIRTIGNHQLQAGGGWDEANYTAELRQGNVAFSGASTGNFSYNTQSPNPTPASPGCPPGVQCSTVSSVGSKSMATSQPGFGLADFLLDYPNSEEKRNVLITERPGGIGSIYLQDSWKATRNLTLNYGVRYDRTVIPPYGTQASIGLQGSIETGDFDFNPGAGNYILQKLPPLCSVRGHAPCLPSASLPDHVILATGSRILHGSKDNFGPHVGFAYRVNESMSVRGGFGITYDNWAAVLQTTQNYQGSWPDTGSLQISNTNTPGTPYTSAQNPFGNNASNLPAATPFGSSNVNYMVDPRWQDPYSEMYNFGLEQMFGRSTIFSLNYVGSASHRLDIGGYYNTGTPAVAASFAARGSDTGQPFNYIVPEKSWDHNAGSGSYNALQASLVRHFNSGLGYTVAYTWSKALNDATDGYYGEGGYPEDPYDPRASRGPAGFNDPQILTANMIYELPFGVGKPFSSGSRLVNYVIGNWQTNGILTGRTGQNFNVEAGGDIANTGNGDTYERANLVGNPNESGPIAGNPTCIPPAGPTKTRQQWFNPCAFTTPASGELGNAPRNFLTDQDVWNLDASVFRSFPIRENIAFKLDIEAFNALNHPILGAPGAGVTSPSTFGQVTGVSNASRILQFSGKFEF